MANRSKKKLLIDASCTLFLERGFKGTSIDSVVTASGVSKPTVYNHFPDKSDLMAAVIEDFIESECPRLSPDIFSEEQLWRYLGEVCLTKKAVRLLSVVLSEGFRFPAARTRFIIEYVGKWESLVGSWCEVQSLGSEIFVARLKSLWFDALCSLDNTQ